jgi:hypothetical protein
MTPQPPIHTKLTEDIRSSASARDLPVSGMVSEVSVAAPRLTGHSMHVLAQPIRLSDDLVITSSFPQNTAVTPVQARFGAVHCPSG